MSRSWLVVLPLILMSVGCTGYVQERVVVREPGRTVVVAEAPPPVVTPVIVERTPVIIERRSGGYWTHRGHDRVWVEHHRS